jgi:divalent metal cation (Fe/Co/Zn/Cd) transporter
MDADRSSDVRLARRLSAISVVLGAAVAFVAVSLGIASGSLSMIGFGLDSAIDSAASVILVWRFTIEARGDAHAVHAERVAEHLVAVVLVVAAGFLIFGAARSLLLHLDHESSSAQIVLLVVSLVALPPLAVAKRRVADRLGSNALRKDALLTAAGALLALVALLAGQLAPSIGLWWADSVGTIIIALVLGREGLSVFSIRGDRAG